MGNSSSGLRLVVAVDEARGHAERDVAPALQRPLERAHIAARGGVYGRGIGRDHNAPQATFTRRRPEVF
jgi:hypothetical protein